MSSVKDFLKRKDIVITPQRYLIEALGAMAQGLLSLIHIYMCIRDSRREDMIAPFVMALTRAYATMDEFLEEHDSMPERSELLDFYFDIAHFLNMYEIMDDNYVVYSQQMQEGEFMLKLFCVNPANNLKNCMYRGRSTILFSATFLPIQYYKKLLGGEEQDYDCLLYTSPPASCKKWRLYGSGKNEITDPASRGRISGTGP